jgi:rhodanese-related sulfurtransferase
MSMSLKVGILLAVLLVVAFLVFRPGGGATGSDARALVESGARLVDVRTPQEFAAGHIPGAVNIPVQELERRMSELEPKDEPIVVYCQSGSRSSYAARMLGNAGYSSVHDLGPMRRW